MEQLSFIQFKGPKGSSSNKIAKKQMYIDGASRSNPGPSGAGIFIKTEDKPKELSYFLGHQTNNQAEYLALVLGLLHLKKGSLKIISDSLLLVRQIKGEYKVRNENIKNIYLFAVKLLENFDYTIVHVLREKNKDADRLANIAIDKKVKLPNETKKQLLDNNIKI